MTRTPVLRLTLSVLCLSAPTVAFAGVYKWVDAQGITHYSESPPPGTAARPVDVPAPQPPAGPTRSLQERARALQEQRLLNEQADDKRRSEEMGTEAKRSERCINARESVHVFEQQRPVFSLNERGERIYIEDADRAAALEAVRHDIEKYCPK